MRRLIVLGCACSLGLVLLLPSTASAWHITKYTSEPLVHTAAGANGLGWACGSTHLWRTTDYGVTWERMPISSELGGLAAHGNCVWVGLRLDNGAGVFYSRDAGKTWVIRGWGGDALRASAVIASADTRSTALLAGNSANDPRPVPFTTDGGATWSMGELGDWSFYTFGPTGTLWMINVWSGQCYYYTDLWHFLDRVPMGIARLDNGNPDDGFTALGYKVFSARQYAYLVPWTTGDDDWSEPFMWGVMVSTDGGQTWKSSLQFTNDMWTGYWEDMTDNLAFSDSTHGFALQQGGVAWHTVNGGKSWAPELIWSGGIRQIAASGTHAWAVSSNGTQGVVFVR